MVMFEQMRRIAAKLKGEIDQQERDYMEGLRKAPEVDYWPAWQEFYALRIDLEELEH